MPLTSILEQPGATSQPQVSLHVENLWLPLEPLLAYEEAILERLFYIIWDNPLRAGIFFIVLTILLYHTRTFGLVWLYLQRFNF